LSGEATNPSLLKRVATGDAAALQECIDRYGGLVWSLARRYFGGARGGAAEAEDAVQEIFISLWENASRFDESVASETTFVAMIARRRLIDRRRRLMRRRDTGAMPIVDPAASEDVVGSAELSDEARRASAVLAQLRPEQKQVLELSLVHGRTYEQIAESTGMPVGTVKTHARRGLIRVREIIGESAPDASSQPDGGDA
jgi:RNA polymerase sigma-70 factor (ECF subfamily)